VADLVACRVAQRSTRSDSHDEAIPVRPPCWVARYLAKQVRRRRGVVPERTKSTQRYVVKPRAASNDGCHRSAGWSEGQLRRGRDSLRCSPAAHSIDTGTDLRNGQVLLWASASRDDDTLLDWTAHAFAQHLDRIV